MEGADGQMGWTDGQHDRMDRWTDRWHNRTDRWIDGQHGSMDRSDGNLG
jgi:hypothetical protein